MQLNFNAQNAVTFEIPSFVALGSINAVPVNTTAVKYTPSEISAVASDLETIKTNFSAAGERLKSKLNEINGDNDIWSGNHADNIRNEFINSVNNNVPTIENDFNTVISNLNTIAQSTSTL